MQTAIVGEGMSRLTAREAFHQYRNALKQCRSPSPAEDELLMKTYREIARGRRVLDLRESLKLAGLNERWQPKLAIARADQRMARFFRSWNLTRWCFMEAGKQFRTSMLASGRAIVVPRGTFPQLDGVNSGVSATDNSWSWSELRAAVPAIPPALRPAHALANYHILWEAQWESVPGDPILLRRIGAHLYAVVAQWDLTPVEQAVLRGRYES